MAHVVEIIEPKLIQICHCSIKIKLNFIFRFVNAGLDWMRWCQKQKLVLNNLKAARMSLGSSFKIVRVQQKIKLNIDTVD